MQFYWLTLGVLAVWRLTHLLNAEDGPGDILVRFRLRTGDGFWGGLLDCFYCLSVWVAAPFAYLLGETWTERLLLVPALSAAAIVIERLTADEPPVPHYVEDSEVNDGMLRKEPDHSDDHDAPGGDGGTAS